MWAYQPLSGDGTKKHGGRFNRQGCPALYTSLDITTAWMEAQQGFPFKAQPMTLVAYQVSNVAIVDLNDSNTLQALNFSQSDLACPWEYLASPNQPPPTWLLVDKLLAHNLAGVLVRSFAPGCTSENQNLVLWRWGNIGESQVSLIDNFGRLPKTAASWQVNPD
jgi:RES domain-containing protein